MHISWNEIKAQALRFSKEWENEVKKQAEIINSIEKYFE